MGLFNTVKIRTPESVELAFELAGIGSRAVALLIDYTVLSGGLLLILWIGIFLFTQLLQFIESVPFIETLELWLIALFSVALFALYIGYFVGFETWWQGQTPGKRYAHIRVIRDDGQPMRVFQATLRSLARPVDDILFLGFFLILLNSKEKRIGDWIAGTLVVQTDPRKESKAIVVSENAKTIGTDLLNIMDFTQVSPDDFATLREFLQRRSGMTANARKQVSTQMAGRIREKTGLDNLHVEMTADTFVEAVYWAYQQKSGR